MSLEILNWNYLKYINNLLFFYLSLPSTSTNLVQQRPSTSISTNRVYLKSGMIPRYTGYLPRIKILIISQSIIIFIFVFLERKYHIGQTYGDTSRNLAVCAHSYNNYGDYVRSKTSIGFSTNDVH